MKFVFGYLVILLFSVAVLAGGVVSNPADSTAKPQVWFLGKGLINTCVISSKDYFLPKGVLMDHVGRALARWRTYVDAKQVIKSWPKDKPFLNFDFKISATCKGNEDVKFYFGTGDAAVQEIQKKFTNPSALSHLESYDQKTGRGKGFIWINHPTQAASDFFKHLSPDGDGREGEIRALLMHEIGHMLGCSHVAGTIMREDLPQFMAQGTPLNINFFELKYFSLAVEHRRELFFNYERGMRAMIPPQMAADLPPLQKEFYEKLLKKKLTGAVLSGVIQGTDQDQNRLRLLIGENNGPNVKGTGDNFFIDLDPGSMVDFTISDSSVFRSVFNGKEDEFKVRGFIIDGKMTIKSTGEQIPVTYSRNRGDDEFVRLLYTPPGKGKQEFFKAYLYDQQEGY